MAAPSENRQARWAALLATGLPALALVALGAFAMDRVGISTDEPLRQEYGRRLVAYYSSWGADRSILGFAMANYYGGLYDLAGELLARLLSAQAWWVPRHYLTLGLGAVGIFATGRLAARFGGLLAAGMASSLLLLTARWSGHAFFDPKDIPFSVTYLLAVATLVRLADELPRPRTSSWILVALATGACLSVRIGGLLLLAYLAAALGIDLLTRWKRSAWPARLAEIAPVAFGLGWRAAATGAAALALAIAFWPYLQSDTLRRLVEVYRVNAAFPWHGKLLFLGQIVRGEEVGRAYLPVWLGVSLPLLTLIGLVLAALFRRSARASAPRPAGPATWVVLLLSALFPIAWVEVKGAVLYNGIRHFLFVVPPLTILAALGWTALWRRVERRRRQQVAFAAIAALLALEPAVWLLRSTPYQYVYFHPLVGGLAKASHWFDGEYWRLSLRRAADALDRRADALPRAERLVVRVPFNPRSLTPFLRPDSRVELVRAREPDWRRATLALHHGAPSVDSALRKDPDQIVDEERLVRGQIPFWVLRTVRPRALPEPTSSVADEESEEERP